MIDKEEELNFHIDIHTSSNVVSFLLYGEHNQDIPSISMRRLGAFCHDNGRNGCSEMLPYTLKSGKGAVLYTPKGCCGKWVMTKEP